MFNSYEFTFAGESSAMYGLMIYDIDGNAQDNVPFGNRADIIEDRTLRRIQPIHFGVDYNSSPLEFRLVFGSERYLDRYDLESISLWLTGHQQYQWLTIDQPDLARVQFRCLFTEVTPISIGWLPIAFEATVRCDCPYAYGPPFHLRRQIQGETEILFQNNSSVREYIKPDLFFQPDPGTTDLRIVNESDSGREFLLSSIPEGAKVSVDNRNGIITESVYGYNLYPGFNMNFFRLVRGANRLAVTGNGALCISGRLLYNVAG